MKEGIYMEKNKTNLRKNFNDISYNTSSSNNFFYKKNNSYKKFRKKSR